MLRRKFAVAVLTAAVAATAILMTGCVNGVSTGDGGYEVSIWQRNSLPIVFKWAGATCAQDIDHSGAVGPNDRANCAFFIIRGEECNQADGFNKALCYRATDYNGENQDGLALWADFNRAAHAVAQFRGCLGVQFGAFGQVMRWERLAVGSKGCHS